MTKTAEGGIESAIVPAAGQGTRLRPLTDDRPKPLVEVAGRPLLAHVIDALPCLAAKNQGREFIGIEQDPAWADVARARCGLTPEDPGHLLDDGATPLSAYTDGGAADD